MPMALCSLAFAAAASCSGVMSVWLAQFGGASVDVELAKLLVDVGHEPLGRRREGDVVWRGRHDPT